MYGADEEIRHGAKSKREEKGVRTAVLDCLVAGERMGEYVIGSGKY